MFIEKIMKTQESESYKMVVEVRKYLSIYSQSIADLKSEIKKNNLHKDLACESSLLIYSNLKKATACLSGYETENESFLSTEGYLEIERCLSNSIEYIDTLYSDCSEIVKKLEGHSKLSNCFRDFAQDQISEATTIYKNLINAVVALDAYRLTGNNQMYPVATLTINPD